MNSVSCLYSCYLSVGGLGDWKAVYIICQFNDIPQFSHACLSCDMLTAVFTGLHKNVTNYKHTGSPQ